MDLASCVILQQIWAGAVPGALYSAQNRRWRLRQDTRRHRALPPPARQGMGDRLLAGGDRARAARQAVCSVSTDPGHYRLRGDAQTRRVRSGPIGALDADRAPRSRAAFVKSGGRLVDPPARRGYRQARGRYSREPEACVGSVPAPHAGRGRRAARAGLRGRSSGVCSKARQGGGWGGSSCLRRGSTSPSRSSSI